MSKRIVVLYSGGLDSVVMKKLAEEDQTNEVILAYFDIGHEYAWKEKMRLPPETHIHDMQWFGAKGHGKEGNSMNNIFIPGRNMIFATIAAGKYIPDEIWLGALMGEIHDQATDKNETFRAKQNNLLAYVMRPFGKVKLVFPFVERGWGKFQVTEWAVKNGLKDEILESSSCMSGEVGNCGCCGVCLRRAGIFAQLGLKEEYNVNPWSAPENRKLIRDILVAEIKQDSSHYDEFRRQEIVPALRLLHPDKTLDQILELYQ